MRYCTSLSLNQEEYKRFLETKKGIKEVFLLGLEMAETLKAEDDPCTRSL